MMEEIGESQRKIRKSYDSPIFPLLPIEKSYESHMKVTQLFHIRMKLDIFMEHQLQAAARWGRRRANAADLVVHTL